MTTPKKTAIPAAAKVPQDHRPASAAEDVTGPVDVTVTWRENDYTVPGEAFDDAEFLDAMIKADGGDSLAPFRAARALLGEEIWTAFCANERGENGRVKTSDFMELFTVIMDAAGRKN